MNLVITIVQIALSLLLIGVILLQAKGTGLGTAWGGEGGFYHARRGMEQVLFIFTIILTAIYFVVSVVNVALF